jgi:hypothetical protein
MKFGTAEKPALSEVEGCQTSINDDERAHPPQPPPVPNCKLGICED